MINLFGAERVIKKVHLGLTVSLFFLLLYAGGCSISRPIAVANLDSTIESFACRAAEGAKRVNAKIKSAELKVNVGTAFDMEAGTIIPSVWPVTAKAGTHFEEGTTLTITLDLDNVQCKCAEGVTKLADKGVTEGTAESTPIKTQIYEINAKTHKIVEKLKSE
jgi:hypothetical protein